MQPFISAQRETIVELCRNHHVLRLSIFGSAARDDFDPSRSDVDVIVDFAQMPATEYARNKRSFHQELSRVLSRHVDLLTWESVRNPYLLKAIQLSNETLYAA